MTIQVKFHHEDSGFCRTTFKAVNEDKYFNRIESDKFGCWYTVYPSQGYWENSSEVKKDVMFEVVDNDGKVLFIESNGNIGAFSSTGKKARDIAADIANWFLLKPYEDWKQWLLADKVIHGYTGYDDNWLHAEAGCHGSKEIGRYYHLGIKFIIYVERMDHIICGKEWRYVHIVNEGNNSEAICGFLFD